MTINIQLPQKQSSNLKPMITVIGVGGAGGNAVNNMIASNLEGVNFVVANTDAQALENSSCQKKIQLGTRATQGLGAGAAPQVGASAAEESIDEIESHILGSHMVFITAGMGGGTGTGAAPVIAKLAKENNILTVGVITKPFMFEGAHRMRTAESGILELQKYVDTLIIIPNQNLFRLANERTTFADAFKMADDVLHSGVGGITDLMVMPGLINLDFADIRAVMSEMGKAMMGTGEAEGERRALDAAEAAISNPLLDDISMKGARGVLINITGGLDLTLFEVDEAANRIREEVDPDANIIFGSTFNKDMSGRIRVSVVATGIGMDKQQAAINAATSSIQQAPAAAIDPRRTTFSSMTAGASIPKVQPSFYPSAATQPQVERADLFQVQAQPQNHGMEQQAAIQEEAKQHTAQTNNTAATEYENRTENRLQAERPAPTSKSQSKESSVSFFQKLGLIRQPQTQQTKIQEQAAPQQPTVKIERTLETVEISTSNNERDFIEEVPAFLRRRTP